MARYHVRADGSMGVCTAKEGHCPFGAEDGTKHFTNETEARAYSEKMIAGKSKSRKALKRDATTAIGKDAVRVDSCSRTLYGDVDVDKARAEVNEIQGPAGPDRWRLRRRSYQTSERRRSGASMRSTAGPPSK